MSVANRLRRARSTALLGIAAGAEHVPHLQQSALQRARVDTSRLVARPIVFALTTGCVIAAATVIGTVVAAKLPLLLQIGVGIAAVIAGMLVAVVAILGCFLLLAIPRQRTEAREELTRLTHPTDFEGLAKELSNWVAEKEAAVPQFGAVPQEAMFVDGDHPLSALFNERQDELARLDAQARTEYHQRFRARVSAIVGADLPDPQTVSEFTELAARVRTLASDAGKAEAIAAAQGTPISGEHFSHLAVSRDRTQLDLRNEKPLETFVEAQSRSSFLAHHEGLRDHLEQWEAAIQEREAALAAVAVLIPEMITAAHLDSPEYLPGALAGCFTESVSGRLRRRDYVPPPLQLRCVATQMSQVNQAAARLGNREDTEPEPPWNAYLNAGAQECLIRTVVAPLLPTAEAAQAYYEEIVAPIETDLEACYGAILRLPQVDRVKVAQVRLRELGEPILDELKRQKISGVQPVFSSACPYCLAAVGI